MMLTKLLALIHPFLINGLEKSNFKPDMDNMLQITQKHHVFSH
jgi:hypothetical protein